MTIGKEKERVTGDKAAENDDDCHPAGIGCISDPQTEEGERAIRGEQPYF